MTNGYPGRNKLAAAIAVTALAGGVTSAVHAQQMVLEEIIVTAQKRVDTLQTVPMTVDVVTADRIREYNLLTFEDVQAVAPGVTIKAQDSRTSTIAVRGVNVLTDSAYGPGVAIYWNELNYDIDSAFKAMYDVSQIEVLRGPQGTLRGITAPAGAVTIATTPPNFYATEGYVQQTFGQRGQANTQVAVGLPLIEERLALRVAGLYDHNRNEGIDNITTGKTNRSMTRSGRMTLGYQGEESFTARLTYQYMEGDDQGNTAVEGCGLGNVDTCLGKFDRKSVDPGPNQNQNRREVLSLQMGWGIGDYELVSITGYQEQDLNVRRNMDLGNVFPVEGLVQTVHSSIYTFTQELRLSSANNPVYNWTYGLYGTRVAANTQVGVVQPLEIFIEPFPGFIMPVYDTADVDIKLRGLQEGYAAFTHHSWQVTDQLELMGGLRYQTQRQTNRMVVNGEQPPAIRTGSSDDAVTGSASIAYELTPDMRLYATYGRSWRAGGFTTAPGAPADIIEYDPETSDSLELGFKSILADGRVHLNTAIFEQRYKDFLARTPGVRINGGATGVSTEELNYNADARVRGVELQLDMLVMEDWRFGLGVSYTDAKFTGGSTYCNQLDGDGSIITPSPEQQVFTCPASGRLAGEPNWGVSASSDYTFRLEAVDLFLRGLYSFKGGRVDDTVPGSVNDASSYATLDVFAGVRDKQNTWELMFWVKNLFDREAVIRYQDEAAMGATPVPFGIDPADMPAPTEFRSGYRPVQLLPERQFGITARYNFDF